LYKVFFFQKKSKKESDFWIEKEFSRQSAALFSVVTNVERDIQKLDE